METEVFLPESEMDYEGGNNNNPKTLPLFLTRTPLAVLRSEKLQLQRQARNCA